MGILVVGSVALDSVATPFGTAREVLGGSATYFSTAASYFASVSLVAVVGEDFPAEHLAFLQDRSIDLKGLQQARGRTFRWRGEYGFDLSQARTIETQLNVFGDFLPQIPEEYQEEKIVFLANIDPDLQRQVLRQVKDPQFVAADTMNYWIEGKLDSLKEMLREVDVLIINDAEARELAKEPNLVKAARQILSWGPSSLIVKRGEYGALMFRTESCFAAPAFPLEAVCDPTGAGDSFAGGFVGYLANTLNFSEANIRKAVIMGSVMASFNVEDFSLYRLKSLTYSEIEARFREFKRLSHFEDL